MLAILPLVLAGCGETDARGEVEADTGYVPVAQTDSAQTDSALADSTLADTASADTGWALRDDGIGPLRVGMTVDEARAALGQFRGILPDPGGPPDSLACGYAMSERLPPGVRVMLEDARVVRVEVDSGYVPTAGGARIGDTEARIQQLYSGRVQVQPHKYTDGHYLVVRPTEASDTTHLLLFETDGRVVTRFRGGQKPQVEYVEGCA
jgi:hypothetical protein